MSGGHLISSHTNNYLRVTNVLLIYWKRNDILWQDGLAIDFLQKKTTDLFIRKFLINASYLFNERLVFDNVIKFYINFFLKPTAKFFIFEFSNLSDLFSTILVLIWFFAILFGLAWLAILF